ncbi:hypothetical protein QBC43DRAFT_311163 [Cladorrhinum sp. PSN259]|nr:hypothetical protein QBC43DRAFT_311163 [Cladorrhinum sp. PSN259]
MKITALYVYPIKALRGTSIPQARIGPRGVEYDRHFILYEVRSSTSSSSSSSSEPVLKKMQLDSHPKCALFQPEIDTQNKSIKVHFLGSPSSSPSSSFEGEQDLTVPLEPDVSSLPKISADLHGSVAQAYAMGEPYDAWFSLRFGVPVRFVYIGDGRRPVLAKSLLPPPQSSTSTSNNSGGAGGGGGGWLSSITSYITTSSTSLPEKKPAYLTFTDVAPLLVTSESSLRDVSLRLFSQPTPVPMYKFRPNIVVKGDDQEEEEKEKEEEAWAEDYWAELTVTTKTSSSESNNHHKLAMTGNCVRCTSLNVDYDTGKPAEGEMGTVLKKLMKERRVDAGSKWSPVFGRYGFPVDLDDEKDSFVVSVGDEVKVTKRNPERTVLDWPGM